MSLHEPLVERKAVSTSIFARMGTMRRLHDNHPENEEPAKKVDSTGLLSREGFMSFAAFQIALIVLYAFAATYDTADDVLVYQYEKDVSVMIVIGFGFLMTFLRKCGYTAIGYTLLLAAFCIQWTPLVMRFFSTLQTGGPWARFPLNEADITQGQFGAATVMITFGALIGKVSADQMVWMAAIEIPLYGLNSFILGKLGALDMGGSTYIHTFGAAFGLAASFVLSPRASELSYEDCANSYAADITSFIGTTFLWVYWPSFNAAVAPPEQRQVITINTILALCASAVCTFYFSRYLRGEKKYDVVDIQNATLAGGVAVGAASNLLITPAGALGVGSAAGILSVFGYVYAQPYLLTKYGLHDTCGVANLHFAPGVLGTVAGVIATAAGAPFAGSPAAAAGVHSTYSSYPNGSSQWLYQLAGGVITIFIAVFSGFLVALAIKVFSASDELLFSDQLHWNVPTSNVVAFNKADFSASVATGVSARQKRAIALARWGLVRHSLKIIIGKSKSMHTFAKSMQARAVLNSASFTLNNGARK